MDIELFQTNQAKEVEGVWFPLGGGAEVLVAREGNDAYNDYLNGLVNANRALIDGTDKAARKAQKDLLIRAYAHTVLKGWKGLTSKGEDIPFSKDKALELLQIPDFFKKIQGMAQQMEAYQDKAEEDLLKN